MRADNPLTGIELAKATGLSFATITGIIDRLEKAGYVRRKRDDKDRRLVLVFIIPNKDKAEAEIGSLFLVLQE
jgi:DNA-binding MarR family transcriptional regulator